MDLMGSVAFPFAMIGFIFAISAMSRVRDLEDRIEELENTGGFQK